MSVESNNEDCNCDVVVLEQPHCNLLHSIALISGDATGETTPMVDYDSQTKKSRSRLRWMPAAHVAIFKDGRNTQAAPFLTDPTNWMDIMLVRQLLADKPFEVAHGKSTAAWNTSAHYLSLSSDPARNPIFPLGINGRQMKHRFAELMAFTRKLNSQAPMQSGCDDEETGDLQLGLEELLELSSAVATNATMANTSLAVSRAQDKEKAETLRKASLGALSVNDLRNLRSGKKRKTANCVSPTPLANDMMSFNKDLNERMEARSNAKENIRKEWLALKAKQLEIKQVEQERNFQLQQQQMKMQADMFRFFQQQMARGGRSQNNESSSSDE